MSEENREQNVNSGQSDLQNDMPNKVSQPSENTSKDEPKMSEFSTLLNIFMEPGRTFKDLRIKPRFILATVVISILAIGYSVLLIQTLGDDRMRSQIAEQINKSPSAASMDKEQKNNAINMQMTISKYSSFAAPIFIAVFFALGALIYWGMTNAMGGAIGFLQSLSVWVYSSFPPSVVAFLGSFIVLLFKDPDQIELATANRGMLKVNFGFFVDGKTMPAIYTFLSSIDLFAIWGLVLAAIGLKVVGKLSTGSAAGIVIVLSLIGVGLRVLLSFMFGTPM